MYLDPMPLDSMSLVLLINKHRMSKLDQSAHTLNTSTTKVTYSFSKGSRFLPTLKPNCDLYYELPNLRSKRAASFGVGQKLNITVDLDSPSPGTYTQPSTFENPKHRGFSFGVGRDEVVGGPLSHAKHTGQIPGPGCYALHTTLDTPTITIKQRLPDFSVKRRSYVPGPGAYDPPTSINAKGEYVVSTHVNSRAAKFSLDTSLGHLRSKSSKSPGPADYSVTESLNKQGKYFNSRYENSLGKSFGKCPRPGMSLKHMANTPGPGNYKPFSQFDTISN